LAYNDFFIYPVSFMRAIEITKYGAPEVLQLCEREIPQAQTGEVLIKVHAAGVNRPDVLQRLGYYPVPQGLQICQGWRLPEKLLVETYRRLIFSG
jgi:D-arabinose 1-dehydrogenase-like Zn-dependent alcohol dehydrogenase